MKDWFITVMVIFIVGFILFFGFNLMISCMETSTTTEYSLSKLDDDIYGIYTVVSSNVPAKNYEMITLCVNGQVCTFRGDVNIYYCDDGYKLILVDNNLVNGDVMNVYVPRGSIEYSTNVGIGSR